MAATRLNIARAQQALDIVTPALRELKAFFIAPMHTGRRRDHAMKSSTWETMERDVLAFLG